MTASKNITQKITLIEQRQALCQQLLAQRQLIAMQLDLNAIQPSYPRSTTMRFLTRNSVLGNALLMNIATLLGVRVVKSLSASFGKH